jgi:hypothetical protein
MPDKQAVVDAWIKKLAEVKPNDGILTDDVTRAVGGIPSMPGEESFSRTYASGLAGNEKMYALNFLVMVEGLDNHPTKDARAAVDYWTSVESWIARSAPFTYVD